MTMKELIKKWLSLREKEIKRAYLSQNNQNHKKVQKINQKKVDFSFGIVYNLLRRRVKKYEIY